MSVEAVPEQFQEFIVKKNPPFFVCMDDRNLLKPLIVASEAGESKSPYNQIAGGAAGIALNYMLAYEAALPYSISESEIPRHKYANQLAWEFNHAGVYVFNHESCAALAHASSIVVSMHDNYEEIFAAVEEQVPDLKKEKFARVAAAAGRIALLMEADELETDEALRAMETHQTLPIETLPLEPGDHAASDLIIDRRPDHVFEVAKANRNNTPAYFGSLGNLLMNYIKAKVPIDRDLAETAFILRHSTIALNYLTSPPPESEPLNIHIINRD